MLRRLRELKPASPADRRRVFFATYPLLVVSALVPIAHEAKLPLWILLTVQGIALSGLLVVFARAVSRANRAG